MLRIIPGLSIRLSKTKSTVIKRFLGHLTNNRRLQPGVRQPNIKGFSPGGVKNVLKTYPVFSGFCYVALELPAIHHGLESTLCSGRPSEENKQAFLFIQSCPTF